MSEALLFENTFVIEAINNQKYDRVSRISAHSEDNATFLMLDVNTELFPLAETERIKLALALTLNLDGSKDDTKGWREVGMGEQTLANEYDYVCHGKVYRFEEGHGDNMYGQPKAVLTLHGLMCAQPRFYLVRRPSPIHRWTLSAAQCSQNRPRLPTGEEMKVGLQGRNCIMSKTSHVSGVSTKQLILLGRTPCRYHHGQKASHCIQDL
jgi:DNA-directed RNA polymerases I, II, and III subunit RPABC3